MLSEPPSNIAPALPVVLDLLAAGKSYRIVLPHSGTDYIQKKLVADRAPYEREMLEDLATRLRAGELVLDIGANIGNHTLYLAAVAGCRVVSFEPNPELCAALRESLRLNGLEERVQLHQAGLGRQPGQARFGNHLPENLGGQHLALGEGELTVLRLDDLTLPGPARVMKIDVEGMELDVLEGGAALIARDRPLLYVECGTEAQYRSIARHLEGWNYTYWETFNATPTHLFIPTEQISLEQRLQHLQAKAAETDYRIHQQLKDTRSALNDANVKYRGVSEQVGNLKQRLAQEEAARQQAAARVGELEQQLEQRARELAARQEREATLARDRDEQSRAVRETEKAGVRSDALLEGVKAQLEAANTKYRESTQRYGELKERLGQVEATRQAAAQRATELQAQLEAVQKSFEVEREQQHQRLAALEAALKERGDATLALHQQLARSEAGQEGLRAQLEAAQSRQQDAASLQARLEERLARHEADRLEATARLAQLQTLLEATQVALSTSQASLGEERTQRQARLDELERNLLSRSEAVFEAQKQIIKADTTIEGLKAQLDAANLKYREVTTRYGELAERQKTEAAAHREAVQQHGQAQGKLTAAQQALETQAKGLREQLASSEAELARQREARLQVAEQLSRAEAERADLQARLAASLQQAGQAELLAREARDDLQQRLEAAEAQLLALREQAAASQLRQDAQASLWAERLAQVDGDRRALADRLDALQQSTREAEAQAQAGREALLGRLAEADKVVAEQRQQLETVSRQVADTQVQLAAAQAGLAAERDKLYAAQMELAERAGRLVVLQQTLDVGRADLETLQHELREREGQRKALDARLHAAEELSTEQRRQIDAAQAEISALRELQARQATDAAVRRAESAAQLAGLQDQLVQQQALTAATRTELEGAGQLADELRRRIDDLRQAHDAERQALASRHEGELRQAGEQLDQAMREAQAREATLAAAADAVRQDLESARLRHGEIARAHADLEHRLEQLQREHDQAIAQGREREQALVESAEVIRQDLDTANLKYRESTRQYGEIKDQYTRLNDAHQQALEAARQQEAALSLAAQEVREDLDAANLKYREVTRQYGDLKAHVHMQEVAHQAARSTLEQNKIELLKSKQGLNSAQREIERLKNQKIQAENQVAKTRAMLSFQVGYALVHGFKSPTAMLKLPKALWTIYRNHQTRKQVKTDQRSGARLPVSVAAARSSGSGSDAPLFASGAGRLATATARPEAVPKLGSQSMPGGDELLLLPMVAAAQRLKALKVAAIMDEFTYTSYAPECNLLQLTPTLFRQELESFKPDLLFIESAWRGKDDLWGSKVGHLSQEVQDILAWCREHKVPTVFWNKEDPIHFETFLTTARLFDHVFTTDIDCIHRYKAALGHDRVYLLPFAAQPALSNPIEKYQRKDAFCFAGAYYVRYPERTRDLGNFVTTLADYKGVEIYDRNYGKNDVNYQFPPEYQPFIVGNLPFEQIDKAYKGYNYAINLNSIKQSQSMFARRVFELLASNTITVSNFSRGVRLMFGDLVVTTDSGEEIVRRLKDLCADETRQRKFRLAALRKVMSEHTYQDRFAYLVSKVQGESLPNLAPDVVVTAYAKSQEGFDAILKSYGAQRHASKRLVVVIAKGFEPSQLPADPAIKCLSAAEVADLNVADIARHGELVCGLVPEDYYGPNYLTDLALATRFSTARAFGKGGYFSADEAGNIALSYSQRAYKSTRALPARSALIRVDLIGARSLRDWVTGLYTTEIAGAELLSVDEFNYCRNGANNPNAPAEVDDLADIDAGISIAELVGRAEGVEAEEEQVTDIPCLSAQDLQHRLPLVDTRAIKFGQPLDQGIEIQSALGDGKHEYFYAREDATPDQVGFIDGTAHIHFAVTPGLNLQIVYLFLDEQGQRIGSQIKTANRNHELQLPAAAAKVRLGLRVYGSGTSTIRGLHLGHLKLRPATVVGRAPYLLLTNHYPAYDDLYRNGFVHSRVAAYGEVGVKVDVFRLRENEVLSFHEFKDHDVITGAGEALEKIIEAGTYRAILVHFLDVDMWQVLKKYIGHQRVVVWVHGAEVQPLHRREYNYTNDADRAAALQQSEARLAFWRGLLAEMPPNLELVFVSRYFAEEVMEDLGLRLPENKYHIIHNPIDTDLFQFQPKDVAQRQKILSIRPYASRKYANDLSVEAILKLSKQPWFAQLEIRMVGDGKLFDEVLEPLRKFDNVILERRFLSQQQIADLHQQYGIFLCPTRMDAQGVSRDEAMSSGLIPITNGVTAIPEFVSEDCGVLAGAEDSDAMANGIRQLVEDPELFSRMSAAAAARVRQQSSKGKILAAELHIMEREP